MSKKRSIPETFSNGTNGVVTDKHAKPLYSGFFFIKTEENPINFTIFARRTKFIGKVGSHGVSWDSDKVMEPQVPFVLFVSSLA